MATKRMPRLSIKPPLHLTIYPRSERNSRIKSEKQPFAEILYYMNSTVAVAILATPEKREPFFISLWCNYTLIQQCVARKRQCWGKWIESHSMYNKNQIPYTIIPKYVSASFITQNNRYDLVAVKVQIIKKDSQFLSIAVNENILVYWLHPSTIVESWTKKLLAC